MYGKTILEVRDEYGLTFDVQAKARAKMKKLNPKFEMEKITDRGYKKSVYSKAQVSAMLSVENLFITKQNGKKILARKIKELD